MDHRPRRDGPVQRRLLGCALGKERQGCGSNVLRDNAIPEAYRNCYLRLLAIFLSACVKIMAFRTRIAIARDEPALQGSEIATQLVACYNQASIVGQESHRNRSCSICVKSQKIGQIF
jgi:hypothetical protein